MHRMQTWVCGVRVLHLKCSPSTLTSFLSLQRYTVYVIKKCCLEIGMSISTWYLWGINRNNSIPSGIETSNNTCNHSFLHPEIKKWLFVWTCSQRSSIACDLMCHSSLTPSVVAFCAILCFYSHDWYWIKYSVGVSITIRVLGTGVVIF